MKTLDEVIRAIEWCTELDQSGCGACPYSDTADNRCYEEDALCYLKRYRERCQNIEDMMDRYDIAVKNYEEAVKNCELTVNKYIRLCEGTSQNFAVTSQNDPDGDHQQLLKCQALLQDFYRNDPLTWQELKQMEGKPVWVEIIGRTIPLDSSWGIATGGSYHTWQGVESWRLVRPGAEYSLPVADYGKTWQAYRKERS